MRHARHASSTRIATPAHVNFASASELSIAARQRFCVQPRGPRGGKIAPSSCLARSLGPLSSTSASRKTRAAICVTDSGTNPESGTVLPVPHHAEHALAEVTRQVRHAPEHVASETRLVAHVLHVEDQAVVGRKAVRPTVLEQEHPPGAAFQFVDLDHDRAGICVVDTARARDGDDVPDAEPQLQHGDRLLVYVANDRQRRLRCSSNSLVSSPSSRSVFTARRKKFDSDSRSRAAAATMIACSPSVTNRCTYRPRVRMRPHGAGTRSTTPPATCSAASTAISAVRQITRRLTSPTSLKSRRQAPRYFRSWPHALTRACTFASMISTSAPRRATRSARGRVIVVHIDRIAGGVSPSSTWPSPTRTSIATSS